MGNWDFDGDEMLFFVVACIAAVIVFFKWYVPLARVRSVARGGAGSRLLLALTLPTAMAGLWFVLSHWADPQYVVGQLDYQLLFLAGGMMWIGVVAGVAAPLGIHRRDDAVERNNPAAALAIAGAVLGGTAIYAGGNVGAGPTIWTTILPAAGATLVWITLWLLVELASHPAEAIAIDRDLACGVRHGGWLLAAGIILGRAVAGDWTAWASTFGELLALGWLAAVIAAAAGALNVFFRPTPAQPHPALLTTGVIPAAVMILLAVMYVMALGPAAIGEQVITYEEYMRSR